MTFPDTQFAGLSLIDYVNGATPQEFFKESDATQWDAELIALTAGLRAGEFRLVFNATGVLIEKGKPVKLGVFNVPNLAPVVTLAQADAVGNLADGVALADIAIASVGIVVKRHVITGLDTSPFTVLDDVFLDSATPGDLTATAGLQRLGRVTVDDAVNGQIEFDVERGGVGSNPVDDLTLENAAGVLRVKQESIQSIHIKDGEVKVQDLDPRLRSDREIVFADVTKISNTVLLTVLEPSSFVVGDEATYRFKAMLFVTQVAGVANLKLRVNYTGNLVTSRLYIHEFGAASQVFNEGTTNIANGVMNADHVLTMSAGDFIVIIEGYFEVDVPFALDKFAVQFAQAVSNANNTQIRSGSYLTVDRIDL